MAREHDHHQRHSPALCAPFQRSPETDSSARVCEGPRLVEESALIRELLTP